MSLSFPLSSGFNNSSIDSNVTLSSSLLRNLSPLFYKVVVVMKLEAWGGTMARCKKCGVKLNFSNNFGGICEECYDKRLKKRKPVNSTHIR